MYKIIEFGCGQLAWDFWGVPPIWCGCGKVHYSFSIDNRKVWLPELDPFRRKKDSLGITPMLPSL